MKTKKVLFILFLTLCSFAGYTQHTVARTWNEMLLTSIRNDFARPTVHARNLFHISAAMYDAWAAYEPSRYSTWLLDRKNGDYFCPFNGIPTPDDLLSARQEAISYAVFRILRHRFSKSPGRDLIIKESGELFAQLGYDSLFTDTDYSTGNPAALGNYIAESMIEFGLQDGSNEQNGYGNQYYQPTNPPLIAEDPGNPFILDPNRWQPLFLDEFIDQAGNVIPVGQRDFLSPEWGNVVPFALKLKDRKVYSIDDDEYKVFYDPGHPPYIFEDGDSTSAEYQWGFSLVSVWGGHLDPNDGVMWDISPASFGNLDLSQYPTTIEGYRNFYKLADGGDIGEGHDINPHTGAPYQPQIVPRGDYTRVLAEFWADGPDSETPPGHWFTILNYVNDHPELVKKFKGEGPVLDDLEWDLKSYFILGGAVHDAAVSAWGIKGWYDYVRPMSAIRYMADQGQSTDESADNYSPVGIPLVEGYIETVEAGDPLAGNEGENIGKIKLYSWRGHDYITDPQTDAAGVEWILAENWWPYQRPTFVTPPFAGYVSGHSTFSRAAAEVLTLLTGDPFFPGGMGEFVAKKNEFLVFEEGPSMDIVLQWATYRDASDQTSLSRIWGGIHPPADDIPGRLIGIEIGKNAFNQAERYFNNIVASTNTRDTKVNGLIAYPNPVAKGDLIKIDPKDIQGNVVDIDMYSQEGKLIYSQRHFINNKEFIIPTENMDSGLYIIKVSNEIYLEQTKVIIVN